MNPRVQRLERPQNVGVPGMVRERITSHDRRLTELDAMGIDFQLVMPPPPQCYYTVPVEIAVEAARMINDGIAEFVGKKPDRFAGLGSVPMPDGNEAANELERCVGKLGLKGAQILTNVAGRELSDPAFAPFWKKAEELSAFIVLHPSGFTEGKRFARFSFSNTIGNPLETTIALHYLIFDGVLERHPNLKILAVHGGGYRFSGVRYGDYRAAPAYRHHHFHRRFYAPAYYDYPRYYAYPHRYCRVIWTYYGPRKICRYRPWHRHYHHRHRWHHYRYW